MVVANSRELDFASSFYSSIFAQKYSKYHIYIYDRNPVSQDVPLILRDRITVLNNEFSGFEKCKNYDIVLPLKENGELIGSLAFKKLDMIYQEKSSIKVAYSNVLGFSKKHKIPFAKGEISEERVVEEKIAQAFLGNFLWSFKSS